ncbi:alanine:cation symporter family protein [Anoxybacterium hadale]|uniref:Alanine:cation symporter family protein n=1 Tax=Anoxybacterium hadale TaxID=3408580 RepID=A0ACD1AC56_9FIRM|nr:alanine:cation symporter family protein [Clostridiales bacterium]
MNGIFEMINNFFEFMVPITDFLWEFPTNLAWYASIPVLGKFSFAIILLVGAGIYYTIKTRFIQISHFRKGLQILIKKKVSDTGLSPLSAFFLSSAMRIGPGNIIGVTGAISVGGPGALFWMWVSAFFGMATAYSEAVLAQIFKEKKGNEFVGGLPFYGQKLLADKKGAGIFLSIVFVMYALLCLPGQTFHVFTSVGAVADVVAHTTFGRQSAVYYVIAIVLVVSTIAIIMGGIKRVTKVTDALVPVMAVLYTLMIFILILLNLDQIPYFFGAVFTGAFKPEAIFGGGFGVALAQGIKRGLMSNEAGQGTITMAAATADNDHPCEQGFVQVLGVFLDTMIICTMSGFVIVMAHIWTGDSSVAWDSIKASKLPLYLASVKVLAPGAVFGTAAQFITAFGYVLFAHTTLIGMISFAEIAVSRISKDRRVTIGIRILGACILVPFGALIVLAGIELGNLWYLSDFTNLMVVLANVPIILIGSKYVIKATDHYIRTKGERFTSEVIGIKTDYWDTKEEERI